VAGQEREADVTTQLTLFTPKPPRHQAAPAGRYVVEVNECAINTNGHGAAWWAEQHMRPGIWRRLTMVMAAPPGALWYVACEDKEEADWFRDHMVTFGGVHKSTVKVKRIGHEITCKKCGERQPYWHNGWCEPCFKHAGWGAGR
jgi:hypothetical protein